MLSKLTFSLVFVLMLALVASPAFAQVQVVSGQLNANADADGTANPADADAALQADSFVVFQMNSTATPHPNGINNASVTQVTAATDNPDFPNVADLFEFGGTIELLLKNAADLTGEAADADAEAALLHRLVITEIMWGIDEGATGAAQAAPQWIEVYNAGDALVATDDLRLLFTSNVRRERSKVTFKVATADDSVGRGPYDEGTNTADTSYTVVDRVSVINRFGSRWDPPGNSGRITTTAENPAQSNLVSMYRKRGTNPDKTEYNDPPDPNFGDGTDSGQWIKSAGRYNVSGPHVATPGYVQQDDGGLAEQSKDPASLPSTAIIINEIYNSAGLQWIELHNTGTATVNVKNWTMDAAHGDKKQQRVFVIEDDTNIPGGGFLVVTNRDPADSILAGGVDLHDTNNDKFNAGAQHLYIVENEANDEWMPAQGFLLVLRNHHDRKNHEKIVDIAGNAFVKDPNFSDVWPLKGWTPPADRNDNSFGNAANSLMHNTGKTYARDAQKNRAGNPLHNGDWLDNGAGNVGGLGYDPNVDMAIAPGTPGYANNAQKDNDANVTGEIVISEVMYDAGPNGDTAQWIELYNSSMTESAILNGWELEIRNIDTDVESYVDAKFDFKDNAVILPNQTLLLVSDRSSASDVVDNRVYNLYQKHRNELGLDTRRSVLLSSVGFYLRLNNKDGNMVDEAGNVMLEGPRRTVMWELPETGGDVRYSIIRGFGKRAMFDGTPEMADVGTMESAWHVAQSVGSYYGHRDDIGSPGHREGSPLPVSLSSFRPVRDKATGEVVIRWVTESELNNAGFNILRSETKDGEFKVINVKGIIAGHGTTSEKHVYTYTDTTAKPNIVYYYQIEDVSLNGERTTLRTTHLRGNVSAGGKLTTRWGELKSSGK